jgi:hypothetical protein
MGPATTGSQTPLHAHGGLPGQVGILHRCPGAGLPAPACSPAPTPMGKWRGGPLRPSWKGQPIGPCHDVQSPGVSKRRPTLRQAIPHPRSRYLRGRDRVGRGGSRGGRPGGAPQIRLRLTFPWSEGVWPPVPGTVRESPPGRRLPGSSPSALPPIPDPKCR